MWEFLILYNIISERPKDGEDARDVARRQGSHLDRRYLTQTLRRLANALDQPER